MTRIDFYILQQESAEARMLFVCKLADKALRHGSRVFILVADQVAAETLDALLWSFRPESYVPHALIDKQDAADVPVVISTGDDLADHHELLINLTDDVPPSFSRFQRLAEVAVQSESLLQTTRHHYAFFKQRGYPIETHRLAG